MSGETVPVNPRRSAAPRPTGLRKPAAPFQVVTGIVFLRYDSGA